MVALEHAFTLYGCSGGPISIRPLPDSQVPPPLWSLADPGVRVLWGGGYVRLSLLECRRWTFLRQRLHQWLCTEGPQRSESGLPPTGWTWQFLVQTGVGCIWLERFLAAIHPHWSMLDQLRLEDVASSAERTQDESS